MAKIVIVDGSNLLFQMFYGMPSRIINKKGRCLKHPVRIPSYSPVHSGKHSPYHGMKIKDTVSPKKIIYIPRQLNLSPCTLYVLKNRLLSFSHPHPARYQLQMHFLFIPRPYNCGA